MLQMLCCGEGLLLGNGGEQNEGDEEEYDQGQDRVSHAPGEPFNVAPAEHTDDNTALF